MQKTKKISLFLILCLISVSVLTWCQNNTQTEITTTEINLDQNDTNTYSKQIQKTTLVLNQHGCIWCWICTQVAPDNFSMRWRKAAVTSQKNITSTQVDNAIKNCPTSVIEIINA